MKTLLTIFIPLAAIIQSALLLWPGTAFANVIHHVAAYGWCSIIIVITATIPLAGLYGLALLFRDLLKRNEHPRHHLRSCGN